MYVKTGDHMNKPKIILSTSLKGGVGKSTVAANVAYQLSLYGYRVLLCDLDFDVRSLDLIMGYENSVLFDICDVLSGRRQYKDAKITDKRSENLFFLGAPYEFSDSFTSDEFAQKLRQLAKDEGLDYVILDTAGADTFALECALKASDEAMVIASHTPASLRGAQKSARMCEDANVSPRLIVNNFDYSAVVDGKRAGMIDIIDSAKVSLLGVVPYDVKLVYAQERGILASNDGFVSHRAFKNIAQRIVSEKTGERYVPILKGVKKIKRKKVLTV